MRGFLRIVGNRYSMDQRRVDLIFESDPKYSLQKACTVMYCVVRVSLLHYIILHYKTIYRNLSKKPQSQWQVTGTVTT